MEIAFHLRGGKIQKVYQNSKKTLRLAGTSPAEPESIWENASNAQLSPKKTFCRNESFTQMLK